MREYKTCRRICLSFMGTKGWVNGSFTVEAAYLIPIALLLFAVIFRMSMSMTDTIHTISQDVDALQQLDALGLFIKGTQFDSIKELLLSGGQ